MPNAKPCLLLYLPGEPLEWLSGVRNKFESFETVDYEQAVGKTKGRVQVLICGVEQRSLDLVKCVRAASKETFICIFNEHACNTPTLRMKLFNELRVNMVSFHAESAICALERVLRITQNPGKFECVRCGASKLSEDSLWLHEPLYHANEKSIERMKCPICRKITRGPFAVHLHHKHGPIGRGEEFSGDANSSHPTLYSFALVVCRNPNTGKYLVVQEFCNSGYWLPGGAVDAGEDIKIAALRETKEEAGLDVELKGILRFEMSPRPQHVRLRVIFYAEPINEELPKSIPDFESVGATWISAEEIAHSHLRGREPFEWSSYLENGGPIYPLTLLTKESTKVTIPETAVPANSQF